jgi:hypothetical protein
MFLRKRGKPASLADIISGIKAGGGNPGPEGSLRTSLTRSTYQIAKINDDLFGLVEFYGDGLSSPCLKPFFAFGNLGCETGAA